MGHGAPDAGPQGMPVHSHTKILGSGPLTGVKNKHFARLCKLDSKSETFKCVWAGPRASQGGGLASCLAGPQGS